MALANIAWILASRGKDVLIVDWDLEAPGLHRYFHPFLQDKNLASSDGVIDMVMKFEDAAIKPGAIDQGSESSWYLPLANIERYVVPLAWNFPQNGVLDLLPAGRQSPSYAARVNAFNWLGFYDRLGGGVFLEALKGSMRKKYDYILIDSRTGVSDTAGVCTVQMPDILVVCFTLNIQSIEGAAAVAGSVYAQRREAVGMLGKPTALQVFPVPMRVEQAEKARLEQARGYAQRTFAGFLDDLPEERRDEYWGKIDVPYVPFYAYQEVLATIADTPGVTNSLVASLERLTGFLTGGEISSQDPLSEKERQELIALYIPGIQTRTVRSILAKNPELQTLCDTLTTRQNTWTASDRNRDYLLDPKLASKLRSNVELQIALLEDPQFREFWDASQINTQRRQLERTQQFLSLYRECRYQDQLRFYEARQREFEAAHDEVTWMTAVLMVLTALAAALAAANIGKLEELWSVLAVVFPALFISLLAYNGLYGFARQAKLYGDGAKALLRVRVDSPDLKPAMNDESFSAAAIAHIQKVEQILSGEVAQWGQFIGEIDPVTPLEANPEPEDHSP